MACNCNRSHYQINRDRRLLPRLNLEFFALRQCAMGGCLGGWVSSFIIRYYCTVIVCDVGNITIYLHR